MNCAVTFAFVRGFCDGVLGRVRTEQEQVTLNGIAFSSWELWPYAGGDNGCIVPEFTRR